MKSLRRIASISATVAFVAIFASCSATDIVAKVANTSFKSVADASGSRVAWLAEDSDWSLSSTAGDKVIFSSDFSRNSGSSAMADMDKPDIELVFDAAPFLAAGLDMSRLPMSDGIEYRLKDGTLMLHFELGSDAFSPGAKDSIQAIFAEIVRTQRVRIGYHEALDHYGIKLGNGNMFEWAKDLAKNDKDIVWVLNPEPFIAAGLDPAKLQGWAFAKVETKDDKGKTVFVDKLLKPFNL